jgi:hypothetical protein
MNKISYKGFKFILNDANGDGYYRPQSVDIFLTYTQHNDSAELVITELIDNLNGGLIISQTDENFNYMMDIYKNGVFDCIAVSADSAELTVENLAWLEREFISYLKSSENDDFKLEQLHIIY